MSKPQPRYAYVLCMRRALSMAAVCTHCACVHHASPSRPCCSPCHSPSSRCGRPMTRRRRPARAPGGLRSWIVGRGRGGGSVTGAGARVHIRCAAACEGRRRGAPRACATACCSSLGKLTLMLLQRWRAAPGQHSATLARAPGATDTPAAAQRAVRQRFRRTAHRWLPAPAARSPLE